MSETPEDENSQESGICEINITEVERRCTGTVMPLQDVYIAYQVESIIREPRKTPYIVWRRYRDFEYLHSHLQDAYRYVVIPPLPEKKVQFRWQKLPTDTLDPEFVERRRASLETFLRRVAGHLELSADRLFGEFLRHEASWRDDHSTGGFLHRADSMLRIFNASLRLRNPDKEFEEVKRYSTELKTNLTNFLRSRARLVDATLDFHTLHQQYGQVLSELSHRDGPGYRGDRLQAAGQFMDRLSQAALPFFEEQEEAADRLKEYLAYADALLAVCKHQEVLEYELERKKSLYASRESQRAEIASSGAPSQGLVSRLLHSSSTPEQKMQALEQQLQSLDAEIRAATREKQEFSEKALAEIGKFQEQKERDLNQALSIFVSTNIRLCRESVAIWERVCQCFEEMCQLEDKATPTSANADSPAVDKTLPVADTLPVTVEEVHPTVDKDRSATSSDVQ
ncbi:sorting nexin-4-like isoform X2 [Dermacentor albipictus]|uniref:sorting nexin-4-like isoform X2 n=1 Tax=Dermacentor albipictus TaxID=60249 RepID=UPI0031FE0839